MMKEKILKAIEEFGLLLSVASVTVALSGGADSMALLYALSDISKEFGFELSAAHFNHKIRGAEAERDEQFVKRQCEILGVKLFIGSADVPKFASEHRLSLELAARKLRYDFLNGIKTDAVATAHTATDNTETVLFNLARGSGLKGICGIPPKRDNFIRPLILCTRRDIEEYCSLKKIPFVTDSTNLCDDYSRNKIRHNAVPVLREINPALETAVSRAVQSFAQDSDFLEKTAAAELEKRLLNNELSTENFSKLHRAVAIRVLRGFYEKTVGASPDFLHLRELYGIAVSGGRVSVSGGKYAVSLNGKLGICDEAEFSAQNRYCTEISEKVNVLFKKDEKVNGLFLKNAIDCDKIVGKLVVRTRMPGDKIKLSEGSGTKTLKKLFCEKKIPVSERESVPVAADENGVVWVFGQGTALRCRVDENSKKIFIIKTQVIKGDGNDAVK